MVINIINKFNINNHINEITNGTYIDDIIIYKKEEIIKSDLFDNNLDEVCLNGIHYFKSIEPAFYYEINKLKNINEIYKKWFANGQIEENCNYKND